MDPNVYVNFQTMNLAIFIGVAVVTYCAAVTTIVMVLLNQTRRY